MTDRPSYHQTEEFQNRSRKLAELREKGPNPYPHNFKPENSSLELQEKYEGQEVGKSEDAESKSTDFAKVSGRLVLFRAMGKNAFAHLQDHSGRVQVMFNRDNTVVEGYNWEEGMPKPIKFLEKKLDLGDIVGVEGHLFRTMKGELTLFAHKATLLTKSLMPLPEKHSGLVDKEIRYRKRWLDLIDNPDVKERFVVRSKIFETIRDYMRNLKFLEVETPILQNIYGGAEARPFTSKFNALNQEMFLRISLEIPLKKLIVGGMDRVFEMGKVFRNEGIDKTHNPEFTLFEAYASYWDYNDMMEFSEKLFEKIALDLFGTTKIPFELDGETVEVDVKAPWKRLTMKESIVEYAGVNVDEMDDDQLRKYLHENTDLDPKEINKAPRGILVLLVFEEKVESHLIQPHHITDHPIETTPLCKPHRNEKERKEGLVERFETFIVGKEFCNAYTELNDPEIQRDLLEQQASKLEKGDEEANPLDEEFIEAICQGMPPTGGIGIGIDRLVMLFTNSPSIREVLFFPTMKNLDQQ